MTSADIGVTIMGVAFLAFAAFALWLAIGRRK